MAYVSYGSGDTEACRGQAYVLMANVVMALVTRKPAVDTSTQV